MNAETKHEIREIINSKIESLLQRTETTVDTMAGMDAKYPDPTDRGSLESDRNLTLRIRDRERKLILKLKRALARLDDGSYGLCTVCGEPINEERLKARPEAELCIDCKEENELRESRVKQIGTRLLNREG